MSHPRAVSPRHRHRRASTKPAEAEVSFPIGDFLIRPTDALGRHVIINVQVAPQVRRASSKLVAKNEFGFETEQDAMRWALTHGFEELARRSENKEITSDVQEMVANNNLVKEELEKMWYLQAIETQEYGIRSLVAGGHAMRAMQIAEMLWQKHDLIENPYWRGVYRTRYKGLLDYTRQEMAKQDRIKRGVQGASARQRVKLNG